jgi:DNA repair protein RecN (Recombination protein N)
MIRFLAIRDLAVIERLELDLDGGFTVLTGETGTGKSIVVGALSLLRGARASSDLVRTGADKAVVEASAELPDGAERVLRREISAHGRSRAYIDDRLVSTSTLRTLGAGLLDLHGQHEHQALLDQTSHLDLLDRYAELDDLRAAVRESFSIWRQATDALGEARRLAAGRAERAELVAFELRDIDEVDPGEREDTELATQRHILANADRLHRLAADSYAELYDGDAAVLDRLGHVWKRVEELAELDPAFGPHLEGRDAIVSQLEEIAFALRPYASGVEASPERLQAVEDRLARIERLKRRYGPSLADVLERRTQLRQETRSVADGADGEAALAERVAGASAAYLAVAGTLSERRRGQAQILARTLEQSLAELAMPHTRFDIVFAEPATEAGWTERGIDGAEFYFSANPGEDLRPLARIASGGELSRVMLALRTVASDDSSNKTLVFDEVDAGIGGEAAERVGAKLRALARRYQVICVTHLPQIAVCGTSHHRVTKRVVGGRTTTAVETLTDEGRASEVARMMTGTKVSGNVLETARELLQSYSE